MNQGDLFTRTKDGMTERPATRPLTRHGDPDPSHQAGEALVNSGAYDTQCRRVLHALLAREQSGASSTSAELAHHMGAERHMVARRLPDLIEAGGLVEKAGTRICKASGVSGRNATVWRTTELGRRALRLGLPIMRPEPGRRREAT